MAAPYPEAWAPVEDWVAAARAEALAAEAATVVLSVGLAKIRAVSRFQTL